MRFFSIPFPTNATFFIFFSQKLRFSPSPARPAAVSWLLQSACRLLSPPLHCRRLASLLYGAGKAETVVAVAVVGEAAAPAINLAVAAEAAPAAAALTALVARYGPDRIRLAACSYASVPVVAPLPNIAAHVVQTKAVRTLFPYLMCLVAGIRIIPCHIIKAV